MKHAIPRIWEKNWPEVHAAVTGGLPEFVFARNPSDIASSIPVFCYHVVDVAGFETDLKFLQRNGYNTVDADALLDHMERRSLAPLRSVVITIDDGARNLYDVAFPLLMRYQMKAVAFVAPGLHEENGVRTGSPLSWQQIREMHDSGVIDFQSHTYDHRYVPRWPETLDGLEGSELAQVRELRGPALAMAEDFRLAKEALELRLGKTVRHLAFPQFNGTEEAISIGRETGYEAFWWGVLPHRPDNRPGDPRSHIVRLDGRNLRRLPGDGREPLTRILKARCHGSLLRLTDTFLKRR